MQPAESEAEMYPHTTNLQPPRSQGALPLPRFRRVQAVATAAGRVCGVAPRPAPNAPRARRHAPPRHTARARAPGRGERGGARAAGPANLFNINQNVGTCDNCAALFACRYFTGRLPCHLSLPLAPPAPHPASALSSPPLFLPLSTWPCLAPYPPGAGDGVTNVCSRAPQWAR